MAQPRLNLKGAVTLLVDSDRFTRGLVSQMLRGFGMDAPATCDTGAAAKTFLSQTPADLCLMEATLPDMPATELIAWIRRPEMANMRFVPVIVLSSYTQTRVIAASRDAGANAVIKKPVSPRVLFDHINWIARVPRPFLETGSYVGPDRRFKMEKPSSGVYRRGNDTPETEAAEAADAPAPVNKLTQAVMKGGVR